MIRSVGGPGPTLRRSRRVGLMLVHEGIDRRRASRYHVDVPGGRATKADKEKCVLRVAFPNSKQAMVIAIAFATGVSTSCKAPARTGRSPRLTEADSALGPAEDTPPAADRGTPLPDKRWHVDLGFRHGFPDLDSTKQQLDRRMDLPLRLDVLGVFDRPYTPIDRRSDQGFTSLYGGIGRQENPLFLWTYYVGGGAGDDINHGRFLIETLEVDFKYDFYYTGFLAEYYPWEIPTIHTNPTWEERLRASRPYLLAGLESGYVSSDGEGDFAIAGLTVYHDELKVRDWLFGCRVGLGWNVPVSNDWSINLSGDYTFHFYRSEEYNGWAVTTGFRYRL